MSSNDSSNNNAPKLEGEVVVEATDESGKLSLFDFDLINKYPNANKKISLNVAKFGIDPESHLGKDGNGQSINISPHGIEFKTTEEFAEGTLLKIHINLPDYWQRKQRLVDYSRIDTPNDFRVLARVVKKEDLGRRSKKRLVTVQTLVIDEVDEQVLKTFLQEDKK